MTDDAIDFVSAYCDRWCERCALTARCAAFRIEAAIAMCGDTHEGLALALGAPAAPQGRDSAANPSFDHDLGEATPEEIAQAQRQEEARGARLRDTPLMALAEGIGRISWEWLTARENVLPNADDVLRDALEIVAHDTVLIVAKIHRALHGRDRHEHDGDADQHEIQNDWNGSAKVALISVRRSADAWLTIADATGDAIAADLAGQLEELRDAIEESFPLAWAFVRPGFDECQS
jgi:hypothetical protein